MSLVVLNTIGSLGDLHPVLAVGAALRARDHAVRVVTHEVYEPFVREAGLAFAPMRPGLEALGDLSAAMRRAMDLRRGSEFVLEEFVLKPLADTTADVHDALEGADLFVSHVLSLGGVIAAEARGVPRVHAMLQPMTLWSLHDPAILPPVPGSAWLRRLPPAVLGPVRALFAAGVQHRFAVVDDVRRRYGLPRASRHPVIGMGSPLGNLALFSRVLGQPQPDWPPHTVVTGFPEWHHAEPADPRLEAFLDAGEPPVVFTLGSSAVYDAGDFYVHAHRAARALGARAVLLTGPEPANVPPEAVRDARTCVLPYAPHAPLFRRAAAIVHQGGIGTTARALAAGAPSLVVPHSHDQPDNARRCADLGVARVIPRSRWGTGRASAALRALLGDDAMRARAAAVGVRVAAEDGAGRAADALEACLRGGPAS